MRSSRIPSLCGLVVVIMITMVTSSSIAEDTFDDDYYGHVVFSAMVWNHGDQLPDRVILPENDDSNTDLDLDEDDFGLLTQKGKMRAYNLGVWTRKRYDELIDNEPYDTSLLQMQSTGYDRTVSSGQLFFAGFYPPTDKEKERWNEGIDWQPISILSFPRFHDRMLLPTEFCAQINRQMDHMMNSSEIKIFHEDYKTLLSRIQEHTSIPAFGDNIANIIDTMHKVHNWLHIQKQIGLPMPKWAEKIYPVLSQHVRYIKQKIINPEVLRLKGAPLISHIIRNLKRKRDDTEFARLFQFYVGHDTTIMLLLTTLGVFDDEPIHFCAAVLFELRMKLSQDFEYEYIITVSYKNSDDIEADPVIINLPYCPNPCSFEDFIEKTKHLTITPAEWEEECKDKGIDYNSLDIFF